MSEQIERTAKFIRQLDFANPEHFKLAVTILGVGAVGSAAAVCIAKMGVNRIKLIDYDIFEEHNVGNQLCLEETHLGQGKAWSIASFITALAPVEEPMPFNMKLVGSQLISPSGGEPIPAKNILEGIVISAPDDMGARKDLWNCCKWNPEVKWVLDCRMAAQFLVIYIVNPMDMSSIVSYEETLHSNEEASEEPCGARGIIYTTFIAGAMLANYVKKLQLKESVPEEFRMDVHTGATTQVIKGKECHSPEELALATVAV